MNRIMIALLSFMCIAQTSMHGSYSPAAQHVIGATQTGSEITAAQLNQFGYYAMPVVAAGVAYKLYHGRYVAPEQRYTSSKNFLRHLSERFNPESSSIPGAADLKHIKELEAEELNTLKSGVRALYLENVHDVQDNARISQCKQLLTSSLDKIHSKECCPATKQQARARLKEVHTTLDGRFDQRIKTIREDRKAAKTTIKWAVITAALGAVYASIQWFWPGKK